MQNSIIYCKQLLYLWEKVGYNKNVLFIKITGIAGEGVAAFFRNAG